MKRRDHRWQVHRFEDLFGDGLGLDERDEAELVILDWKVESLRKSQHAFALPCSAPPT
jgi:hypothetical protein